MAKKAPSKKSSHRGEIVGLTVMLLLIVALVAAQADETARNGAAAGDAQRPGLVRDRVEVGPDVRLRAVIDLDALTIVIDGSAKFVMRGSLKRGN